jgi:long-chain fatty acid transport protein
MRPLSRCTAAAVLGLSSLAWAGGFEILDQSPTATGMCDAFAAKADDPSALFYNPAGIAMHPGGGAMVGTTVAFLNFSSKAPDGTVTDTNSGTFVIPHIYLASHLGTDKIAAGIALFPNFGAGEKWNAQGTLNGMSVPFPGRFVASNTQIQAVTLNPTLALKLHPAFAIGFGVDIAFSSVELLQSLHVSDLEGTAHLGGSAQGVGVNFGVLATIVPDRLTAGFSYRSKIDLNYDLKAHFDVPAEVKDNVFDQPASTSLSLPHNFTLGLAIKPLPELTIDVDFHVTLWSDFQDLAVTFQSPKTPGFAAHQGWHDSWQARMGAEYVAIRALALRLGVGFDETPVPASTLGPSASLADRWVVSAGAGYTFRGFSLNVAYIIGIAGNYTSTMPAFPATYSGTIQAFSVALAYQWGKPKK